MPWVDFIWFERALSKIHEHGVSPEEVEQVLLAARPESIVMSTTSEHMLVKGPTTKGRILIVVFDWADDQQTTALPVTAYEKE